VIRSTLSKWLHDAATNPGRPNLVLAMISVLLAATIVFIFTRNFWLVAGPRRLAYSAPHVDSPDLHHRVVKLRCEEAEAAMDVVGVRRKGSQFRSWVLLQFPAPWPYFHAKFER
jgi:hypothetical protein